MNRELLIQAGGVYNILLIVFHLCFWRLFDWRRDLSLLSPMNRRVMPILNLCLTLVFLIFAIVSLAFTVEMAETSLGRALVLMIATFWAFRALLQIIYFKLKKPLSVGFFVFFSLGCAIYLAAFL